jgi:hypothetical protein
VSAADERAYKAALTAQQAHPKKKTAKKKGKR